MYRYFLAWLDLDARGVNYKPRSAFVEVDSPILDEEGARAAVNAVRVERGLPPAPVVRLTAVTPLGVEPFDDSEILRDVMGPAGQG